MLALAPNRFRARMHRSVSLTTRNAFLPEKTMKLGFWQIPFFLLMASITPWFACAQTAGQVAGRAAPKSKDADVVAAIQALGNTYVEAFNKHDSTAIAKLWTENAVYVNEENVRIQGRDKILKEYENLFRDQPDVKMSVQIDSIRALSADTAIEEGRTALLPQPVGEPRVMSQYTAIHVRTEQGWQIADLRDTQVVVPPDTGNLKDLQWLVGTWEAETANGTLDLRFQWLGKTTQNYLIKNHSVTLKDGTVTNGLEVIGVEPGGQQIVSWIFSSDGSHSMSSWHPNEDGWVAQHQGLLADGTETSATNTLLRKDDKTVLWRSENRVVGDTKLPDLPEITIRRKDSK